MATKLMLTVPYQGMRFIWNITQHVGDNVSCQNRPTDVDLVKILLGETIRAKSPDWIHSALRVPLLINGQMDVVTAYWIRIFNANHRERGHQLEDGIISPARGGSFGPNDTWTIVKLNWAMKQDNEQKWLNLPSHINANQALAAELARGSS